MGRFGFGVKAVSDSFTALALLSYAEIGLAASSLTVQSVRPALLDLRLLGVERVPGFVVPTLALANE